jgi:hypothetical protein
MLADLATTFTSYNPINEFSHLSVSSGLKGQSTGVNGLYPDY